MNSKLTKTTSLILLFGSMLSTIFAGISSAGGARDLGASEGSIYLRDFSLLSPQDAISAARAKGKWLLKPFGKEMILYADGSTQLPGLTYPLDLKGWYDIYVAVFERPSTIDRMDFCGIHVKLENDNWFTQLCGARTGLGSDWENGLIDEIYWKRADLTGQDLIIYQPWGRFFREEGGIAYVRLVPLSGKQVTADLKKDEQTILRSKTKHVGGLCDFYSYIFMTEKTTRQNTEWMVDCHKNAGMDTVYYMVNANGMVMYPSKVGQPAYWDTREEPRHQGRYFPELLKDHDPLEVSCDRAHQQGLKCFAWFRLTNEWNSMARSQVNDYSRKFAEKYALRGCDDKKAYWPSLAHEEIQDYKLAILRELVTNYDLDGLLIDFQRTMPTIGYDPPVIDQYVKKYGVSPITNVAERSSPRWKSFRAGYVTAFMRDVKKMVTEQEKKTGKKIQIAARVTPRDNLWKGLDVQLWIKEGLIDIIMPSNNFLFDPVIPVKPFKQMVKGTKCKVYVCINPYFTGGTDDPEHDLNRDEPEVEDIILKRCGAGPSNLEYVQQALRYYADGADGVVFYESDALTADPWFFPARDGLIPMFRTLADPKEALAYAKKLESGAESR